MNATNKAFFWQDMNKIDKRSFFLFILSLAFILWSQWQAESDLFTAWQTEEYSHGVLIPFIALLLAWHQLATEKPVLYPSWLGIGCIAIAGCLQLVAKLSAFDTVAEYGLVLDIAGLSLAFLGRQATYVILPALIYLLFAIPLPHLVQATLSEDLQLLSSTLGVWPLDLMGIPVYQEGNVIDLGGYRLQVVEACSGLRYLFPLMSFGYLAAFLLKDRWWKRAIIFLSTIPITIGMNALRIAFIGVTVDLWGIQMAEGFIHSFEGWTVFLACIAILTGEIWLLSKINTGGFFRYEYLGLARGPLFGREIRKQGPGIATTLASLILVVLFGTKLIDEHSEIIPSHPAFASFPLSFDGWQGRQDSLPPDVLQALQLSDYWIATYKRPEDASVVSFYMAYYASQRVGVTTHSPSNCIPGGGWTIDSSQVKTIHLDNGTVLNLTRLLIRRNGDSQLIYYWFDERGRDLTETYSAKWYLLWDSIAMHRSDGALIRLSTPIMRGENETVAEKRMDDFLNAVNPEIKTFVPAGPPTANGVATP